MEWLPRRSAADLREMASDRTNLLHQEGWLHAKRSIPFYLASLRDLCSAARETSENLRTCIFFLSMCSHFAAACRWVCFWHVHLKTCLNSAACTLSWFFLFPQFPCCDLLVLISSGEAVGTKNSWLWCTADTLNRNSSHCSVLNITCCNVFFLLLSNSYLNSTTNLIEIKWHDLTLRNKGTELYF